MLELIFPIGILPSKLYPRVVYSLIHLLCYTRLTLLQCQCHSLSLMPHVSHSSVLFGCFATILHIYNRIKWNTHCPRRYGTNYYQNRRGASWEYCTKFAVVQLLIYSYIAYEIAALVARDVFVAMPSGYSKCLEPFCQYGAQSTDQIKWHSTMSNCLWWCEWWLPNDMNFSHKIVI